jgi:ADP-ribosylglycohydrolase
MIGAIAGDFIGSIYEKHNIRILDFPLFDEFCHFTDDTVLTVAVADCLLHGGNYAERFKAYYRLYPDVAYGPDFRRWAAREKTAPYRSIGNGAAMRASPIGLAMNDLESVLAEAKKSAEVTHNSLEGIGGAQAVASAVYLAKVGKSKGEIKKFIEERFDYYLDEPLDKIRAYYLFTAASSGSVPQAIRAFLESDGIEDAIRKAVSIGGDSDTIACIAGGIAHAFFKKVPAEIEDKVMAKLNAHLRNIVIEFMARYPLA